METTESGSIAGLTYAENFAVEDEALTRARETASGWADGAVSPGVGATLKFLAASTNARNVVEIGGGTGVGTLWLLRGMTDDGTLTSIELEAERQQTAREILQEAGLVSRARLIAGRALEVLPRLTDHGYDLVSVNADPSEYPVFVREAKRLLRPGGVLVLQGIMLGGKLADPAERDEVTLQIREMLAELTADESAASTILPVGSGLLAVSYR